MITSVYIKNNSVPVFGQIQKNKENSEIRKENSSKTYLDSFIKNSKQSAPLLLGFTAILSAADCAAKKIPIMTSIKNNILGFFAPVLISSSAILSAVENKKNPEKNNNSI